MFMWKVRGQLERLGCVLMFMWKVRGAVREIRVCSCGR